MKLHFIQLTAANYTTGCKQLIAHAIIMYASTYVQLKALRFLDN